jgi:Icc protein
MYAMNDEIRLLQFTDPHLVARSDGTLRGVNTRESLLGVLRHARAHHWNADALLLTGDLVNDDPGGYAAVRELFGDLGKPVWCLPGNHDDAELMRQELDSAPFQVGGFHDLGAWRIVLVDSCVAGQAHGHVGASELARLDECLSGAAERHVLVALHHHPVRVGSRWIDSVGLQNSEEFFSLTDRHPCLRAIIWGHVHQSFDTHRKGVRLLGTPSTCAQFLPHADQFAIDPSAPGYRRLSLHADGSLDTEVLRVPEHSSANSVRHAIGG